MSTPLTVNDFCLLVGEKEAQNYILRREKAELEAKIADLQKALEEKK